jgi:hypothetical protein
MNPALPRITDINTGLKRKARQFEYGTTSCFLSSTVQFLQLPISDVNTSCSIEDASTIIPPWGCRVAEFASLDAMSTTFTSLHIYALSTPSS